MNKDAKDNNVVFIGKKPFLNYTNAVETQLNKSDEVIIKARGMFTSRAIDVEEYCKRKLGLKLTKTVIGSELKTDKNNREVHISTIEIVISR